MAWHRSNEMSKRHATAHAQQRIARNVKLPPGYWIRWGGQPENLAAARQRLAVVVPACFDMILLLLFSAIRCAMRCLSSARCRWR